VFQDVIALTQSLLVWKHVGNYSHVRSIFARNNAILALAHLVKFLWSRSVGVEPQLELLPVILLSIKAMMKTS
jgi:hypothetical protein